jgi:hypothetical protein
MTPLKSSYRGYVYLIGSSRFGWYKIGKSKSAVIRVANIGILLPFKIEVFGVWGTCNESILESELHKTYKEHRINGEWFSFERDFVFTVVESMTVYPSTLVYRLGCDSFVASNMQKDIVVGEASEWKKLKSAAFLEAVKQYMNEKGMEDTKENRKIAKRAVSSNRELYLLQLCALQNQRSVIT